MRLHQKYASFHDLIQKSKFATFYDMKLLNAFYQCEESCPDLPCTNQVRLTLSSTNQHKSQGYVDPKNCSRCVCSPFYRGRYCEITPFVYYGRNDTIYDFHHWGEYGFGGDLGRRMFQDHGMGCTEGEKNVSFSLHIPVKQNLQCTITFTKRICTEADGCREIKVWKIVFGKQGNS